MYDTGTPTDSVKTLLPRRQQTRNLFQGRGSRFSWLINSDDQLHLDAPVIYWWCVGPCLKTTSHVQGFFNIHVGMISTWPSRLYFKYQNSFQTCRFLWSCVDVPAGFPDVRWPCAVSRQWSPIPSVTLFTGHLLKGLEGNKETQMRVDVKRALPNWKPLSHRRWPANQEKKKLKEMSDRGWNDRGSTLWRGRSLLTDVCAASSSLPG